MLSWLIETGIETEYEEKLARSASKAGCNVDTVSFIPFDKSLVEVNPSTVFHGSLQGAEIASASGCIVFENAKQLCCKYYYPRLKKLLLNSNHVFMPYGCLNDAKNFLLDNISEEGMLFMRPDSNRKPFNGQLVSSDTWEKDLDLIGFYEVAPEELVVVSPPRNVVKEWRFFIADGEVITGSLYVDGNKKPRTTATRSEIIMAEQFLKEAKLSGYNPDRIWVLDICETKIGIKYILEVGSFSSSGLYGSDTDLIVEAINSMLEV